MFTGKGVTKASEGVIRVVNHKELSDLAKKQIELVRICNATYPLTGFKIQKYY